MLKRIAIVIPKPTTKCIGEEMRCPGTFKPASSPANFVAGMVKLIGEAHKKKREDGPGPRPVFIITRNPARSDRHYYGQ